MQAFIHDLTKVAKPITLLQELAPVLAIDNINQHDDGKGHRMDADLYMVSGRNRAFKQQVGYR